LGEGELKKIFRAHVIGSLQRPEYLTAAIAKRRAGDITVATFKRIEDRAVDEAIELQEAIGLDVVTDGEQRRASYRDWATVAVSGLSAIRSPTVPLRGLPGHLDIERSEPLTVTEKLRLRRSVATEEFAYARGRASKPLKVTLPHPMHYLLHYGPESKGAYPDPFELFTDAAMLVREECRTLAELGCEYIQIDAPIVTWALDADLRERFFPSRNISADRFLSEAIKLLDVICDAPGVNFALHLCRGNAPTHYFSAGGYDEAAKTLFQQTERITTFLLEYDDWRAGSFESLKYIPRDRVVVLGLISSTKNPAVESADELVARIDDASRYFPRENLGISAQCGFCSAVGLHGFPHSVQEAKLRLIVDVARRVWN
jgi:5-methyltetrahydropteroyltriglutamate--homocysteine methyltransferase